MNTTSKVTRITADGAVSSDIMLVVGVHSIGGTCDLYNNTSAVAADKFIAAPSGTLITLDFPVRFNEVYADVGAGVTEVLIYHI